MNTAWIDSLRRVAKREVSARLQANGLQDWAHHFFRGARVGRRLQDHELPRAEYGCHCLAGLLHHAEVGHSVLERRGHGDDDDVGVAENLRVGTEWRFAEVREVGI